jgi:hypothetical protein
LNTAAPIVPLSIIPNLAKIASKLSNFNQSSVVGLLDDEST